MDSVTCACLMVFCLGAMAGLTEATPFPPIPFLPDSRKSLDKPLQVEVPTQEGGVKLSDGVMGLPFKAIENVGGKINDAISNGKEQKEQKEPEQREEQNVGQERNEGSVEQHEESVKQPEEPVKQIEGQERFGEIKEHAKDPAAVVTNIKSKLPADNLSADEASADVETVVEKAPVESVIREGEARIDEEVKSRQRRNLPIPSTKVVNSRPMVEPRYAVDNIPDNEPSSGAFFEGAKGIVIDEPDALEKCNRPVIIYVNSCKKINLDSSSDSKNWD